MLNPASKSLDHFHFIIQYNDLMKKKKIVENDKAKIEALIIELDEKKNAAIQGAFQQVNKVLALTGYSYGTIWKYSNRAVMLSF